MLAELLVRCGARVTLATPAAFVPDWTRSTLEQAAIHRRLAVPGVTSRLNTGIASVRADGVETIRPCTRARGAIGADAVVLVTSRLSGDALYHALTARRGDWADAGIRSVRVVGDAAAPGPIAWATYAGRRHARGLDAPDIGDAPPFRREVTAPAPA